MNTASDAVQPFTVEESVNVVVEGTVKDGVKEVDVKPLGKEVQLDAGVAFPIIEILSIYQ